MLVATVVGSGVMGERLAGGNAAITLLANRLATGLILVALIFTLAPLSGAHFNPVVTFAAMERTVSWSQVPLYVSAQIAGAMAGAMTAHAMFALRLIQTAARPRH